jgi:lysophospholipase L1-like esterase
MKKSILIFIFIFGFHAILAQKPTYDTLPYAQDYHQKRLEVFKDEPLVLNKIIFLGNSITEFCDWKKHLNDSTVINRGIAGDATFGVLNRLDDVIIRKPAKLILEIGINDICKNIPQHIIAGNIFKIVQRIQSESPKTKIFILGILPTNDNVKIEYPDAFGKNEIVKSVNKKLKTNAKRYDFQFLDLYSLFQDNLAKLDTVYAQQDGLHLNEKGYNRLVNFFKESKIL